MKLAVAALLVSSVAGFSMDMTFSLSKAPAKKVAVKKAPKKKVAAKKATPMSVGFNTPSAALPYTTAPDTLDGSLVGDAGFDPWGFSTMELSPFFTSITSKEAFPNSLAWYREAELMHGRIAQLAVLGFCAPGFGTVPGNEAIGLDAYSYTNPLEAWWHIPGLAAFQLVLFTHGLELRRIKYIKEQGSKYVPGDNNIGQPGGYNPFDLNYSPEELEVLKVNEIKHCRLAMVAIFGLFFQAVNSGESVVDQLTAGLHYPEYASKVGYFFPEGI